MKYFYTILLILFSITIFAQEICDDGIDNDGDGLIDLNDTDCSCNGFGIMVQSSLIPNSSFEDYDQAHPPTDWINSSNPEMYLTDWIQASEGTIDYLNTSGFTGGAPLPFPDGDGAVGITVQNNYFEYIGSCISEPMIAGVEYELTFEMGASNSSAIAGINYSADSPYQPSTCNTECFNSYPNYGNTSIDAFNMTLYGSQNCNSLPWADTYCPLINNSADWVELATVTYTPTEGWVLLTMNFIPPTDISAIALGPDCNAGTGPCSCISYYFFDNLNLIGNEPTANIDIVENGNNCSQNLQLEAIDDVTNSNYQWYLEGIAINGETSSIIDISANNYTEGDYSVRVTRNDTCEIQNHIITFDAVPNADFSFTEALCVGDSITFTDNSTISQGLITNWEWDFDNGQTSNNQNETILYNSNGTYNVSLIVSVGNCHDTITQTLNYNTTPIDVTLNANPSCFQTSTSSIDLTVNSGNSPYTFAWSNNETTQNINNISEGNYIVTITDNNNCTLTDSIEFTDYALPIANFSAMVGCASSATSFSDLSTISSGNISSWNWNFSDGNTSTQQNPTNIFTNTGNFNITLTVETENNCIDDTTMNISIGTLEVDTIINHVSCFGGNNGNITVNPTTGTLPFDFAWSNSSTGNSATSLQQGDYGITITDSVGCAYIQNFTINQPEQIIIQSDLTHIKCYGENSGEINLTITGGTGNYTYNWNNNQSTEDITNLFADTYTVTITDTNNCSVSDSFILNQSTLLESSANPTDISCYGNNDGEIDLDISGGTPPYSFLWNNEITSKNINNLGEGSYSVTITDANNCTDFNNATIIEPDEITITDIVSNILCYGDNNGEIDITVNGGVLPYNYLWNTQAQSQDLTNLSVGNYSITVSDSSNCSVDFSTNITQPEQLTVGLPNDFYFCRNTDIQPVVNGGTLPYNYLWNTGNSSSNIDISPSIETTYSVTITDANNCVVSNDVTVLIYPDLVLNVTANKDSICPNEEIIVAVDVTGGSGSHYSISYMNEQINTPATINISSSGELIFTAEDNCENSDSETLNIFVAPEIPIDFNADIYNGCEPLLVNFKPVIICDDCLYNWEINDKNINDSTTEIYPSHFYGTSGSYDVTCNITDKYDCKSKLNKTEMINVYPNPKANGEANPDKVSLFNSEVNFYNYSENADYYIWDFDDNFSSNNENPKHEFSSVGNYNVKLIAYTSFGCLDTTIIKVIMKNELTFYAPTAFTPGGNGINDSFKVFGNGIDNNNFKLVIYDRWGEPIFQSNDLYAGWSGRAKKSSEIVKTDTYIWICVFKDFNNAEHTRSGGVTVIR